MDIKVSKHTPYLLIGLVIVLIAGHFYDPLQLPDMYGDALEKGTTGSVQLRFVGWLMKLLVPTLASLYDMMAYIERCDNLTEDFWMATSVGYLIVWGYILILHILEKYHISQHGQENMWVICIDMLCIENIIIYLFNILASSVVNGMLKPEMSALCIVIGLVLSIPTIWAGIGYVLYIAANVIIVIMIPEWIIGVLSRWGVPDLITNIFYIIILAGVFVVWKLVSGFIYAKLVYIFSFKHIRIDD